MPAKSSQQSAGVDHTTMFKDGKKSSNKNQSKSVSVDKAVDILKDRRLALRGGFNHTLSIPLSWRPPRSKLIVYVSSAFTGTELERDALINEVLPKLRQRASPFDIEVSFVDMNYGLRDELTLDSRSWTESLRELKRCWNDSCGVFFLSMLSEKYVCFIFANF
jgi:hypothetical protein